MLKHNQEIALMRRLVDEHDWHYDKSDDRRVYERGLQQRRQIEELASKHGNLRKIYEAKKRKVFKNV
jgi:hypothetical protein